MKIFGIKFYTNRVNKNEAEAQEDDLPGLTRLWQLREKRSI